MTAIGIDLGTTYSCVAVWEKGRVEVIPNDQGNRITPSCVAFTQTERLVGDAAKNQAAFNASNTIFDAKRLIGRSFDDEMVQRDVKLWPFKVIAKPNANDRKTPVIVVNYKGEEKEFTAQDISTMILIKMKETAEAHLGKPVKDAVITVPAYFNNLQRQTTKDAGTVAGLNVIRLINEPTAAALAYGLDKKVIGSNEAKRNIMVFDLGGGTFDVSLVAIEKDSFEVKAVSGDTHLGGEDFDDRIVEFLVSEFQRKHGKDISGNARAMWRLKAACEKAKRVLSSTSTTNIEIDGFDMCTSFSRARFEKLNADLFDKCLAPVEKCLLDAKMKKTDVHDVVVVGGSSRIPKIQHLLQDFFSGKELCKNINPDEVVAYGAAAHAAILSGQHKKDFTIVDVIPLSIGYMNRFGNVNIMIPRNSTIPTMKEVTCHTFLDNQTSMHFNIYEGERLIAKENTLLGDFILSNIPRAPKGVSKAKCRFEVDVDGILHCSAEDITTGNKNGIMISYRNGRLSKEDIEQKVKEAEKYKLDDVLCRQKNDAVNALENYTREMEDILRLNKDQISRKDKRKMDDAIEHTIQWLDWNILFTDANNIIKKMSEIQDICNPIIAKIHQQTEHGTLNIAEKYRSASTPKIEVILLD